MKTLKFLILLFLILTSKALTVEPAWELVSMNPQRGYVWNIAINKQNDVFISSDNGIFKSSDNGNNWNWILSDRVDPVIILDNGDLIARRMFQNSVNYFYSRHSLIYSFDNGSTWKNINKFWDDSLNLLNLAAYKNNILISLNPYSKLNKLDFFMSSDAGLNWLKTGTLQSDSFKMHNRIAYIDKIICQLGYDSNNGIFCYSTDLGKNWIIQRFNKILLMNIFVKSLEEIFLLTTKGIYYSNDSCKSWNLKWLAGKEIINFRFFGKDTIIVTAQDGLYYSFNHGVDWNISNSFIEHKLNFLYSWPLGIDNEGKIYSAISENGPYVSTDFGVNWNECNKGYSGSSANDIVFDLDSNIYCSKWGIFELNKLGYLGLKEYDTGPIAINSKHHIFIGDKYPKNPEKNIYRSVDYGKTWDYLDVRLNDVYSLVVNSKDILFTHGRRSTDNGDTWVDTKYIGNYLAVNDEDHVFAFNTGGIYRSTDDGVTWEVIAETEVDPTYNEMGGKIIFNNKTKTAAYYDLFTTDNGRTWLKQVDYGYVFGTTNSSNFAIDSTYNWIYARDNYILRSTDNGKIWKRMDTTGLKHTEFQTIGCSPNGHIYVFGSTG